MLEGVSSCPETTVLVLSLRVVAFSLRSKELCLALQTLLVRLDLQSFVRCPACRQMNYNLELKTSVFLALKSNALNLSQLKTL